MKEEVFWKDTGCNVVWTFIPNRLADVAVDMIGYELIDNPEVAGLTENSTKAFVRAVVKFVASDADRNLNKRLQAYAKGLQRDNGTDITE